MKRGWLNYSKHKSIVAPKKIEWDFNAMQRGDFFTGQHSFEKCIKYRENHFKTDIQHLFDLNEPGENMNLSLHNLSSDWLISIKNMSQKNLLQCKSDFNMQANID